MASKRTPQKQQARKRVCLAYGDGKSIALGGKNTLNREQEAAFFEAQGWQRTDGGWRIPNGAKPVTLEINLDEATPKPDCHDGLLNPAKAADHLGISPKTLRGHVHDGSLGYIVVGRGSKRRRIKFDRIDLDDFKQNHRRQETPPCHSSAKARYAGATTSTSKSGVLDFAALSAARTTAKRKT